MSMRNNLGELIAAGIIGIARPASARFHLIAGGGEYVHRGQLLAHWVLEGFPRLPGSRLAESLEESKQPAG